MQDCKFIPSRRLGFSRNPEHLPIAESLRSCHSFHIFRLGHGEAHREPYIHRLTAMLVSPQCKRGGSGGPKRWVHQTRTSYDSRTRFFSGHTSDTSIARKTGRGRYTSNSIFCVAMTSLYAAVSTTTTLLSAGTQFSGDRRCIFANNLKSRRREWYRHLLRVIFSGESSRRERRNHIHYSSSNSECQKDAHCPIFGGGFFKSGRLGKGLPQRRILQKQNFEVEMSVL